MAESVPFVSVRERAVEARLGHAHGPAGDVDAPELQRRQRLLKTVALLPAQQVLAGHAAVAQKDL